MSKPKGVTGIRNKLDLLFRPGVLFFSKRGIKANHITLLQAPFVVIMFWFLVSQSYFTAFLTLGFTLILDVLDGSWARITNDMTEKGHKYDKALDLFGIYAFLLGLVIARPELLMTVLILGIINTILYTSNEFIKPDVYCGVRTFGVIGLLFWMKFLLQLSILLGIGFLILKIIKLRARRKAANDPTAAKKEP